MSFLTKIFGGGEEKMVAGYWPQVEKINQLEKELESFSDEKLKEKTREFRERLQKGEALNDLLPEAFALVREAAKRTIGQRHFDVQLIGGMVLHEGKIAEMKTGEGKTLAATLAIYLNALEGKGVHVVTVNDYLSKRDANWMGPIYHLLGLTTGCIQHEKSYIYEPTKIDKDEVTVEMQNLKEVSRREAYGADITYGTNNEFGFDYLRDNMVDALVQKAQRGHNFAIVDEVDSILIDEARTPLIISAPDEDSGKLYESFSKLVPRLEKENDYEIDEKMRTVILTEAGIEKSEKMLGLGNIYTEGGIKYVHHLEQALRAEVLFKRDKDYVVKDGEIIIVDEFTGRLMHGRRYSEGLHQALEAKEGVPVQKESRTLATVTFQNYFRMYKKLAGMTGTALTSAEEMHKVYKIDVVPVPTNKPMQRKDFPDSIYRTENGKFQAVIAQIKECNAKGQPVLVGTASISKNEILSALLKKEGIEHELLNAKNHEREAQIIANAGRKGAVTIATNMAGRGVDIKLGGRESERERQEVIDVGGLYILGTERHEARRIDDQLRGRAGRQGDPGTSQFFVSLEDDLMRIFAPDRIKRLMEAMQIPEDQPIENKMISRAIESAQAKIEGFNFDTRKHVLEYDDVMNKQRETIYRKRDEILSLDNLKEQVLASVADEIAKIVDFHAPGDWADNWDLKEMYGALNNIFPLPNDAEQRMAEIKNRENLVEYLIARANEAYELKEKEIGFGQMRQIEKAFYLRTIDMLWMEHLDEMGYLRDSVRLRAYGQKDPLVEYKNEGQKLFRQLLDAIRSSFVGSIYKVVLAPQAPAQKIAERNAENRGNNIGVKKEIGRNDPCPCGAKKEDGTPKKYKHCCGK
jgi:preprotein translocase subunit SecA